MGKTGTERREVLQIIAADTCWGFAVKNLETAQSVDGNLNIILVWLSDKQEPTENELFLAIPVMLDEQGIVLIELG